MAKTDVNMTAVRGDTIAFGTEIGDENGELITDDLTAAYFSCKENATDTEYVFQKTLGNGIVKSSTGKYTVRVAPEDTKDLEPGVYYYDFQIEIDGDVYTPLKGKLTLEQDITVED